MISDIELRDISLKISGKSIVKNINLSIQKGELVSLLGSSGSGKSTVLKLIAGILSQDSGNILINGKIVDDEKLGKRKAVIVFQDFRLFPHMSVGENIEFPMKINKIKKQIRKKRVREILEKVKLSGFENRMVDEISGGQIQRIALARAISSEPKILLLDEPFSSLDEKLKNQMRDLVSSLQKEYKITTILVSHDKDDALQISDKIAYIENGEIIQYDKPEILYNKPNSKKVSDFFSDAAYIEAEVKKGRLYSKGYEYDTEIEDGSYLCQLRNYLLSARCDEKGKFVLTKIKYLGHSRLAKFKHIENGTKLELDSRNIDKLSLNSAYTIDIDKENMVYIKI